eukprot:Skav203772  [mRNA]  locus=scaffold206:218859:225640:+ [translate_table: standard]
MWRRSPDQRNYFQSKKGAIKDETGWILNLTLQRIDQIERINRHRRDLRFAPTSRAGNTKPAVRDGGRKRARHDDIVVAVPSRKVPRPSQKPRPSQMPPPPLPRAPGSEFEGIVEELDVDEALGENQSAAPLRGGGKAMGWTLATLHQPQPEALVPQGVQEVAPSEVPGEVAAAAVQGTPSRNRPAAQGAAAAPAGERTCAPPAVQGTPSRNRPAAQGAAAAPAGERTALRHKKWRNPCEDSTVNLGFLRAEDSKLGPT